MTQVELPQLSLQRYVDLVKRRRWQLVPVSLLGLVIGAKHQMTIEPQLGGNQCRRPAVITLHATTGHEGLKAVLQRVCGNKLQFTNFIAGQCGAR